MKENGKYNNGNPMPIPKNDEEKALAIHEWAENNENLETAIRTCIDNGIETNASCAGHRGKNGSAYLAIKIKDEYDEKMMSIINEVLGVPNIKVAFFHTKDDEVLSIYASNSTKDECFKAIARGVNAEIDLEKIHPLVPEIFKIYKGLIENTRMKFIMDVKQRRITKQLYIYAFEDFLGEAKMFQGLMKKNRLVEEVETEKIYHKNFLKMDSLVEFTRKIREKIERGVKSQTKKTKEQFVQGLKAENRQMQEKQFGEEQMQNIEGIEDSKEESIHVPEKLIENEEEKSVKKIEEVGEEK